MFNFSDHSHRRYNPLSNTWVLVSPHRAKRPWLGQKETVETTVIPKYDAECYLCPTNKRTSGETNPDYQATFVFPNDFSAVNLDQPDYIQKIEEDNEESELENRLFQTQGIRGKCFVICFAPQHNLTLPSMTPKQIYNVVNTWQSLYVDLKKDTEKPYKYLQIFENKGSAMGCSNLHPHGQAWCLETVPTEVSREFDNLRDYGAKHKSNLIGDYVKLELSKKTRIVLDNDNFIVVVPYWAIWPFETLLLPKTQLKSIEQFNEKEKTDLADMLKRLTIKYDNLFETSFPYSMGIHQSPLHCDSHIHDISYFHIHFYPPLLRSATVRKFLVGFELLGEPQRDLTPEQAAERLRNLSDVHYLQSK